MGMTSVAKQQLKTEIMATNVLPPLSLSGGSGEGRVQKLSPAGTRHPRAKQILSESELMSSQACSRAN